MTNLYDQIKHAAKAKGITIAELARRIDVDPRHIYALRKGSRDIEMIAAINKVVGRRIV